MNIEKLKPIKAINPHNSSTVFSNVMQDYRPEKETIIITKTSTQKDRLKSLKPGRRNIKVVSVKVNDVEYSVNKLKPAQSS